MMVGIIPKQRLIICWPGKPVRPTAMTGLPLRENRLYMHRQIITMTISITIKQKLLGCIRGNLSAALLETVL